ncbi:NFX1-type zinc finger-containing protein 1-like [Patiria miniata]|uniref:NF-X1-type domain-containing protein n=1 Tax=Patiria miniata TaxID=46514 RepID=A0A914B1H2_PATMI|nr:NFX1-type zinc finger-containing protein 1-like [Patiria miniata]
MAFGGWSRGKMSYQSPVCSEDGNATYERRSIEVERKRQSSRHACVADFTNYVTRTDDLDPNITGARPKTHPCIPRESDRHEQTINRGSYEHRRTLRGRGDPTRGKEEASFQKSAEPTRKRHSYGQTFQYRGGFGRFDADNNRGRSTHYKLEARDGADRESYQPYRRGPLVHRRSETARLDGVYPRTKTKNAPDDQSETTHQMQSIPFVMDTERQEDRNKNAPICDTSATSSADGNIAELQPKLDTTVQGSIHEEPYQVKPKTKTLPFTEKQLQKFLEGKPSVVLSELSERKDECMALLNQDQISDSTLQLILQVLSILCSLDPVSVHIEELNVVLTMVESSLFLSKHLTRFLVWLPIEEPSEIDGENDNDVHRLGMVVKLLRLFLQNKPSSYSEVGGALILLEKVVTSECLMVDLQQLKISYHAVEQAQRTAKERASEKPPPNNFRDIPIFPESREIRQVTKPFLRKNIIKGRYESVDHYLDVQFRLLREDFVAPLREGVTEFLSDTSSRPQNIRIYNDVYIQNRRMGIGGLVHTLGFDTEPFEGYDWESSKRLLYGSLVCLTKDKFQHVICATVENRDVTDLAYGTIEVRFLNETRNLSEGPYIMAESAAYFEPYRHVLHGLQQINEYNFSFKKYIVDVASTVDPPAYLYSSRPFVKGLRDDDSVTYDLTVLGKKSSKTTEIPVLKIETWPSAEDLHLDESQKAALQTAMAKEFAIIQGPPGTGKTYIGLKIVQLLLHNASPRQMYRGIRVRGGPPSQSPILVVCYTNHALDQFLEGIHHFGECRIIRVGGRSQSDVLKDRNLSNVRRNRRRDKREVEKVQELLREGDENIRRILLKIELPTKVLLNVWALQRYMSRSEYGALLIQRQRGQEPREDPQKLLNWLGVIEEERRQINEQPTYHDGAAYDLRHIKRCGKNRDVEPIVELQKPDVMTDEEASSVERVWSLKILDRWRLYRLWVKRYLEDHKVEHQRQLQIHDDLSKQLQALSLQKGAFQGRSRGRRGWKDPREVEMHLQATTKVIQSLVLKIELPTKVLLNVWALQRYMSRSEYEALLIQRQRGQEPREDPQKLLNWLGVIEVNEHIQVEDEGRRIQMERQVDEMDEDITIQEERQQCIKQQTYHESSAYDPRCIKRCGRNRDVEPVVELQKPDVMTDEEASSVERVWFLNILDRWRLYRLWVKRFLDDHKTKLQEQRQVYSDLSEKLDAMNRDENLEILQEAKVIGMTTTGAAKCRAVLQRLCPSIVVVEEAAEVLEAHIITTLTEKCQHLILIGDHQQLKPNPTVYRLAKQFNLDTSLFERMINNGMPCRSLSHQHRMRPEISYLMKKHFYRNLSDDESVLKMDNVRGVAHNMFFIAHQHLESKSDDSKTKSNQYEAKFLVGLCKYLLQQGYDHSQITILTAYTGQKFCFMRLMDKATFEGVRVCVVDNFQGEENDIILLSLVRSNKEESIGFLRTSNRVCVALSRARMGFYCIGNGSILKKAKLWENILATLEADNRIGTSLPLVCRNHPNKITQVTSKKDFAEKVPLGGCDVPCEYRLPCGHACTLICHGFDNDHKEYKCKKPCVRICDRHHPCPLECYKECKCFVELTKTMSDCGHVIQVSCHEYDSITCPKPCRRLCHDSQHQCRELCGEICLENCPEKCERTLPCGHSCRNACGDLCTAYCKIRVDRTLTKCGHTVRMDCGKQPGEYNCKVRVWRDLPNCNHRAEMNCHKDPETIQCRGKCERVLECGHPCEKLCWESCTTFCRVEVERTLPKCGHTVSMDCGAKPDTRKLGKIMYGPSTDDPYTCKERCEKMLECGHRCPNVCGIPCIKLPSHYRYLRFRMNVKACDEPVERTYTSCGHRVRVPCHKDISDVPCSDRCEKLLSCGHRCPRKCYKKCPRETIDEKTIYTKARQSIAAVGAYLLSRCQESCERELPCGHKCPNKCGEPCPPVQVEAIKIYLYNECQEEVKKKLPGCDHYVSVRCSVDVSSFMCEEKCEEVLPCGHRCPRKCSEVCPKRQRDDETFLKGVLGHPRDVRAYLLSVCQEKCQRELACGHDCPNKCGEPCPPVKSQKIRKSPRGIKTECQEEVKKKLPGCDHHVSVRCSADVSSFICTEKCEKVLPCGHPCPNKCIDPCPGDRTFKLRATRGSKKYRKRTGPRERCEVVVQKAMPCGHKTKSMPCWKAESSAHIPCNFPCGAVLKCGHRCTGNCDSCKQGTQHQPCPKSCNRQLLCGHNCTGSCGGCCSPDCRRCRDDLRQRTSQDLTSFSPCKHNVTHRYLKTNACFRPCNQKLKCKHPCIGVCGEPCPPFCNVCDKKSVRINLPKGQFHLRDMYVYLPDCKHLCQVQSLDRTVAAVKNTIDKGCFQIRYVLCPKCKEPIRHCSRYDGVLQIIRESINTARQICRQHSIALQKNDGATTPLSFTAGKWMRCRRGHVFHLEEGSSKVGGGQEPIACPECLKQKSS